MLSNFLVKINQSFRLVNFYLVLGLVVLNQGCKKKKEEIVDINPVIKLNIPSNFPYPDIPEDNKPTLARIDLGKMLFFDPIMSRDSTISCATCHLENNFFVDNIPTSIGIDGRKLTRNSPTLINVAYQPYLFWDGGNPTLEQQVLGPIDNHDEFDFDVNKIVNRLSKHKDYPALFRKAYNENPSVFSLTRAIANYERTLIGGTSKFDKFQTQNDSTLLSDSEKRGLLIFFGETGECFHCHGGFNFTDYSFRNNGLYTQYLDSGRARVTQLSSDVAKFKVPSLRNVDKTAPYMHDGSISSLEKVVEHYVSGFKNHRNKSVVIQKLKLSKSEQIDLVNFLKTLTDE